MDEQGITVTTPSPFCGASADGNHTWTKNFWDFAVGEGVFTRQMVAYRCLHCGIGTRDSSELVYQTLLESAVNEVEGERKMPRANTAVEAIDREIKALDQQISRAATAYDQVAAKIMELDKLRQKHTAHRRALEARLERLQEARESLVDKAD